MRWELLQSAPHPHAFPPRGGPLDKFGPAGAHPTYPGVSDMYYPNGWMPERWESPRIPPHLHDFPPRGEPLEKFGPQPTHTIPHMGGSLKTNGTRGGWAPEPTSAATHPGGRRSCSTSLTRRGARGATLGPHTPPTPTPAPISTQASPPPHLHLKGGGPTKSPESTPRLHLQHRGWQLWGYRMPPSTPLQLRYREW